MVSGPIGGLSLISFKMNSCVRSKVHVNRRGHADHRRGFAQVLQGVDRGLPLLPKLRGRGQVVVVRRHQGAYRPAERRHHLLVPRFVKVRQVKDGGFDGLTPSSRPFAHVPAPSARMLRRYFTLGPTKSAFGRRPRPLPCTKNGLSSWSKIA